MAKRLVRANYDEEALSLHLDILSPEEVEEGEEPETVHSLEVAFSDLPDEIQRKTSLFGLHQVLVQRSSTTGSSPDEKFSAMQEVIESLKEGNWSQRGGGGYGGAIPLAARALAKVKGVSEVVAFETWKTLDKETKTALKGNEKIQAAMDEIKQEVSSTPKMDLGDLV